MTGGKTEARRRQRARRARQRGETEFAAVHRVAGGSVIVFGYEGERQTVLGVAFHRRGKWRFVEADDLPRAEHAVERCRLYLHAGGDPRKAVPKRWRAAMRQLGIEA